MIENPGAGNATFNRAVRRLLPWACVGMDGKPDIIGLSVALSEDKVHWPTFKSGLTDLGVLGVKLFVPHDDARLKSRE